MKICIFVHTFPRFPGDTSAPFMSTFAEGLIKVGHDVTVLLPYDTKLGNNSKRPYKIRFYKYIIPDSLHILGYSRTLKGDKDLKLETYFLSPLLFLFGFFALLRLVRKEKFEVISAAWIIPNGFIAALVSKLTGVPFTVTIPGSDIYIGGKNLLFKSLVGFASKNASVVLADSAHYLGQLKKLGFNPRKTEVIRYGVDTQKFQPTKKDKSILKKFKVGQEIPIILAVGRLVAKKGFLYLIRAFPEILKKVPSAKLLIVGDGDQKEELLKEIKKFNIETQVIFAGTINYNELSKYYNLGDVFVMPSIKDEKGNVDASPVAMMEAMACGTPVVATKFSGSADLIKDGETGFLVKDKDSKEIASSVIKILKIGKKGETRKKVRKIAQDNFSNISVAKKYSSVFEFAFSHK